MHLAIINVSPEIQDALSAAHGVRVSRCEEAHLYPSWNDLFTGILADIDHTSPLLPTRLRSVGVELPLIGFTWRSRDVRAVHLRIRSLEEGWDDVLFAPFFTRELIASFNAVLRRMQPVRERGGPRHRRGDVLELRKGGMTLRIDPAGLISVNNNDYSPSGREREVLLALAAMPGHYCSGEMLQAAMYGEGGEARASSVSVFIWHIRHKLEKLCPGAAAFIQTGLRKGYRLCGDEE